MRWKISKRPSSECSPPPSEKGTWRIPRSSIGVAHNLTHATFRFFACQNKVCHRAGRVVGRRRRLGAVARGAELRHSSADPEARNLWTHGTSSLPRPCYGQMNRGSLIFACPGALNVCRGCRLRWACFSSARPDAVRRCWPRPSPTSAVRASLPPNASPIGANSASYLPPHHHHHHDGRFQFYLGQGSGAAQQICGRVRALGERGLPSVLPSLAKSPRRLSNVTP